MGSKRGRLLMRQPRVKKDSDPSQTPPDIELSSPPNFLSIPVRLERHSSEPAPTPNLLHVPQSSYLMKQHSHPLLSSRSPPPLIQRQMSHPQSSSTPLHVQYIAAALKSEHNTQRTPSPTVVMVSERDSLALPVYESTVRVRSDELRRSASSPHNFSPREIEVTENPRSSHCPVVRPGPALGCNFCWNTIDGHGRILRRKTKYHCPECQTNLCIVPCFQEYHERQAQDNGHTDLAGKSPSLPPSSTVFKPYTKTGSF